MRNKYVERFVKDLAQEMDKRKWKARHLMVALLKNGVDVSAPTIDRWLKGEAVPRLDAYFAVQEVFAMPSIKLESNSDAKPESIPEPKSEPAKAKKKAKPAPEPEPEFDLQEFIFDILDIRRKVGDEHGVAEVLAGVGYETTGDMVSDWVNKRSMPPLEAVEAVRHAQNQPQPEPEPALAEPVSEPEPEPEPAAVEPEPEPEPAAAMNKPFSEFIRELAKATIEKDGWKPPAGEGEPIREIRTSKGPAEIFVIEGEIQILVAGQPTEKEDLPYITVSELEEINSSH